VLSLVLLPRVGYSAGGRHLHRLRGSTTVRTRELPRGRTYYNGRYYGNFNNRFYGPQYGYF